MKKIMQTSLGRKLIRFSHLGVAAMCSLLLPLNVLSADTPPEGVTLVDLTTDTSGAASSSGTPYGTSYTAAKAFDGLTSGSDTRWLATVQNAWLVYQFNEPTMVNAYTIVNGGSGGASQTDRAPKTWTFSGSTDGETWDVLDSRSGETKWASGESRFFKCQSPTGIAYTYYKFACTENNGNSLVQIHEIYFYALTNYKVASPAITEQNDGSWLLTGTFNDVAEGSVKFVVTSADEGTVEIDLGSYEKGASLSYSFTAASAGLSTTSFSTAKIVVPDGKTGHETAVPGRFSFGGYAKTAIDFSHVFTIVPSESALAKIGSATYSDFPVLLRLSSAITGFDATAFRWDGADMMILDENGTSLSFEVENWNAEGESFVWVKVPTLSASTELTCYFGSKKPGAKSVTAGDVWSNYVGVWHFAAGEAGDTTASDSTGHGLDGTTTAAFAAYAGPFGGSALNNTGTVKSPDYEPAHNVGATFTASGWFKCPSFAGTSGAYNSFVSKKVGLTWSEASGWYIQMNQSKTTAGLVLTATEHKTTIPDVTQNWNYYTLVSDGSTVKLYWNGSTSPAVSKSYKIVANSTQYQIGGANSCEDEYRLRKGAASAAETALEYATMANAAFFDYGEVTQTDASAPIIDTPSVARNANGSYTVSAAISGNAPVDGTVACVVGDASYAMSGSGIGTYTVTLNDLATGTHTCYVRAEATSGTVVEKVCPTAFHTGDISIVRNADASEEGLAEGSFTVSRADAANAELTVNFEVDAASTAVADRNYVALVSPVVIPAGESSVLVTVTPKMDTSASADTTLVLNLAAGLYGISPSAGSAQIKIANYSTPEGWNTWVAATAGKASDAANWSAGHAPTANEKVLFDGQFSTAACEWDSDATQTVAAWKQYNGYTATIEFDSEFPTYSGAVFPLFTVTGDCELLSGSWTHRGNYANYGAATESSTAKLASKRWCLNVSVGGAFNLGSDASINVTGKGFGHNNNQNSPCYGGYSYSTTQTCAPYGSITEPFDPGMGGRSQSDQNSKRCGIGGGAVKLVVAGDVTLDGSILALGNGDLNIARSGGTGGSVWISAKQISGAGTINASGCVPSYFSDTAQAVGSGGRIALYTQAALALSRDNLFCNGAAYNGTSGNSKTRVASAGTIFIKDASMSNGTLLLKQDSSVATANCANSAVAIMGDATFDAIELRGYVVLRVDEGETLTLPGGLASVSSTATAVGVNGISCRGGTIAAGEGAQTISGWLFEPVVACEFPASVSLENYGGIGLLRRNVRDAADAAIPPRTVACTVNGDLAIDATSAVRVDEAAGYTHYDGSKRAAWYGGWTTYYDGYGNMTNTHSKTYGSVFAPSDYGSSPNRNFLAGGAITLTVTGTLTMTEGSKISANGPCSDSTSDNVAACSGGSVNLTAGSIVGTGTISALGGAGRYCYAGGGAGGRIAIRLTNAGATLPDTVSVNAQGRYGYAFNAKGTKLGSAGTVYIENAADGAKGGTILVSNWRDRAMSDFTSATVFPTTPIVAYNNGDAVTDFKRAKLVVTNNAIAEVSVDALKMQSLAIAANSRLDLYGHTLTVKQSFLGGTKLAAGVYTAESAAVAGFVTDSASGGQLVIKPDGLRFILR